MEALRTIVDAKITSRAEVVFGIPFRKLFEITLSALGKAWEALGGPGGFWVVPVGAWGRILNISMDVEQNMKSVMTISRLPKVGIVNISRE